MKAKVTLQGNFERSERSISLFMLRSDRFSEDIALMNKTFGTEISEEDLKAVGLQSEKRGSVTLNTWGTATEFVQISSLGKVETFYELLESIRRTVGTAVSASERLKARKIQIAVDNLGEEEEIAKAAVTASILASYNAPKVFHDAKETDTLEVAVITSAAERYTQESSKWVTIAELVNFARRLSDTPPNVASPEWLVSEIVKEASKHGKISHKVLEEEDAKKLGMGGFLAVGAGSANKSKFLVLEYSPANDDGEPLAIVGKGVTFDSGGLSLKPSRYMEGMKHDMAGAAAAAATVMAAAELGVRKKLFAVMPFVENMPDGKAFRQDDVIRFMNGKTAEIVSTDAEGRLILADALVYAEKELGAKIIIDIATLTGACIVALGHFYTALVGNDESLAQMMQKAGESTGDRIWRLPYTEDFRAAFKSEVADFKNCASPKYGAGTITAAMFLKNFVEEARWTHLDIAGTASEVPGIAYLRGTGATGAPIRALVEMLSNYIEI